MQYYNCHPHGFAGAKGLGFYVYSDDTIDPTFGEATLSDLNARMETALFLHHDAITVSSEHS